MRFFLQDVLDPAIRWTWRGLFFGLGFFGAATINSFFS